MNSQKEINQTRQTPVHEGEGLVPKTASTVDQLTELDLTLPDLVSYHHLDTAMARNAQGPDTLEAANHRFAMISEKHKDNPEVLAKLQNFAFRDILAFDEGVPRPHLVPKDLSQFTQSGLSTLTNMSDITKAYLSKDGKTRGMKTGTITLKAPSALTEDQEKELGVYLRRDHNGVSIPGSPVYFEHDLWGIHRFAGMGEYDIIDDAKIHTRNKGFARYLKNQGKSLEDIISHIPSQYVYIQFMNEIPLNSREKAFLLNLSFAGFRNARDEMFDGQDVNLWTASGFGDSGDSIFFSPRSSLVLDRCNGREVARCVSLFSDMV